MIGCHDFGVHVHILFSFYTTDPKYGQAFTVWDLFVEHHVVIKPVVCSIFKGILCYFL